jgi:nicotinamidase/pyrazinamidase
MGSELSEAIKARCTDYFEKISTSLNEALLCVDGMSLGIIDLQRDFCPPIVDESGNELVGGGSLAVPNGNDVFGPVNRFKKLFRGSTFITRDSHVAGDITFASTHKVDPFTQVEVSYPDFIEAEGEEPKVKKNMEVVWPDHCVEGTEGCELSPLLEVDGTEEVIRKGFGRRESYSAVLDTLGQPSTTLLEWLDNHAFTIVFISGLARDYCAGGTAEDLSRAGKVVFMLEDATKPVAARSDGQMTERLRASGVQSIRVAEVFDAIKAIEPDFDIDSISN